MTNRTWDKRPVWEQMGIKKFKRDGETIFQWDQYEIALACEDCDYQDWYLQKINGDDRIKIRDFKALAQFIIVVNDHEYDIPYPPLPTEQEIKIKEAQARLDTLNKQRRDIEREIEQLKDGYEDD